VWALFELSRGALIDSDVGNVVELLNELLVLEALLEIVEVCVPSGSFLLLNELKVNYGWTAVGGVIAHL